MAEQQHPPTTIKNLADQARTRALSKLTEAAFAKACLQFESLIIWDGCDEEGDLNEGDDLTRQIVGLLKMLAFDGGKLDANFWQIAMIWLDGHGYGKWTVVQLHHKLAKLRLEKRNEKE